MLLLALAAAAALTPPSVVRLYPLGGQRGTEVEVEFTGARLDRIDSAEFDQQDLAWKRTIESKPGLVRGVVAIGPNAALGPHWLRLKGPGGKSNAMLFNAGQFAAVREMEPNDEDAHAQAIPALPAEVYGELKDRGESDYYAFEASAGERLTFEIRAIEYGSNLDCRLHLLNAEGRLLVSSDDRSDYDDAPYFEHQFAAAGRYLLHVDQYHGPRAADPKNNTYILRVSGLPRVDFLTSLGGAAGSKARTGISGNGLLAVESVWLARARQAEFYRLTYPHNLAIDLKSDPSAVERIQGTVVSRSPDHAGFEFDLTGARPGLWRLWIRGSNGETDVSSYEVSPAGEQAFDGVLRRPGDRGTFPISVKKGAPVHLWVNAAQYGSPHLDSVLELRDGAGRTVASNDDIVSGAASLGNPDSSLFHTPDADGEWTAVVRDRLGRGGPSYVYRLRAAAGRPSFHLWALPESIVAEPGGTAEIKVQMAREEGFEKEEVEVWVEGAFAAQGKFRADQAWELGADGLQMTTPELALKVSIPETLQPGTYAVRIFGKGAGQVVEAHANLWRGPLTNLFNFVRRPMPSVEITVVAKAQ